MKKRPCRKCGKMIPSRGTFKSGIYGHECNHCKEAEIKDLIKKSEELAKSFEARKTRAEKDLEEFHKWLEKSRTASHRKNKEIHA